MPDIESELIRALLPCLWVGREMNTCSSVAAARRVCMAPGGSWETVTPQGFPSVDIIARGGLF